MPESKDVISVKGVTKVYSDNGIPVHALGGIDLTILFGEFTAIVGPSGSGKTTFLNIIFKFSNIRIPTPCVIYC